MMSKRTRSLPSPEDGRAAETAAALQPTAIATLQGILTKSQPKTYRRPDGSPGKLLDLELLCGINAKLRVTVGQTRQQPNRPDVVYRAWPLGTPLVIRAGFRQDPDPEHKQLWFRLSAFEIEPAAGGVPSAHWYAIGRHVGQEEMASGRPGVALDISRTVQGRVFPGHVWWEPTGPETIGVIGQLEKGSWVRVRGDLVNRVQRDRYGMIIGRMMMARAFQVERWDVASASWVTVAADDVEETLVPEEPPWPEEAEVPGEEETF